MERKLSAQRVMWSSVFGSTVMDEKTTHGYDSRPRYADNVINAVKTQKWEWTGRISRRDER